MSKPVTIVLTGGPCAGKTTALARISERLTSVGYQVYLVPEVATMVFGGGVSLAGAGPIVTAKSELAMVTLQLQLEGTFERIAEASEKRTVLLCDRGAMDVKAYVSADIWQAVLHNMTASESWLRDHYDAVIHLVTAADGAEDFYTLVNNAVRTETPREARFLDMRIRQAWMGHPHFRLIDNTTDFEGKIRRLEAAVCRVVGIPEPLEIERKFLVSRVGTLPEHAVTVDIEQTYLRSEVGDGERVRKRGQNGSCTYTHTIKNPRALGGRFETEERISAWEYIELLQRADDRRQPVKKTRTCFLYEGRYFELDTFIEPKPGLQLLEIELDSLDEAVNLPPCIAIEREVTDDPAYSNSEIARCGGFRAQPACPASR